MAGGEKITRFEEWERANGSTFARRKNNMPILSIDLKSFLFSDRELLIQNFQLHLRNKSYDQTDNLFLRKILLRMMT